MISVLFHIIEHVLSNIVLSFPKLCLWTEESLGGVEGGLYTPPLSSLDAGTGGTSSVKGNLLSLELRGLRCAMLEVLF